MLTHVTDAGFLIANMRRFLLSYADDLTLICKSEAELW